MLPLLRMIGLIGLLFGACLAPPASAAADSAIAVIMAPGHGKSVKKDELALIYKRKKLFWPDGSRIQPVNLPVANPLRREFSLAVLGATPEDLEQYWNDMYFHGISPPYVLASDEAVLRFVSETPDAVGYVSYCSVGGRAKAVLVLTPAGRVIDDLASIPCGH